MTLQAATDIAREQSKSGCVQHVNRVCRWDVYEGKKVPEYHVSDWYDGTTVTSFEGGRQK